MKAVKLKTEYLKNPLGIDIKNPRFMWNCEGGKAQSAYRLIASDTQRQYYMGQRQGRIFTDEFYSVSA